jgi:hypothetical protein
METDPVSETLRSLEYRTTDKAQKLSNPKFIFNLSVPNAYFSTPPPQIIQSAQLSQYRDGPRAGKPGFDSRQGKYIFSSSSSSQRPDRLRPTQPPNQWVTVDLSQGVKRPGREADHSPSSNVEVNNDGGIPPLFYTSASCCIESTLFVVPTSVYNATKKSCIIDGSRNYKQCYTSAPPRHHGIELL